MGNAMCGHERPIRGATNEWLTPPKIVSVLGPFDLDPCPPIDRPWDTATTHYTIEDDGLSREWHGRVWLNPPYGPEVGKWMGRLADHGDGIALIFARTETKAFFETVWERADAVLFIKGRLHFHRPDGERAALNAGAPSVLVAYGPRNVAALRSCGIEGQFLSISRQTL